MGVCPMHKDHIAMGVCPMHKDHIAVGVCPMHKDHIAMGVCPMHKPQNVLTSLGKKFFFFAKRARKNFLPSEVRKFWMVRMNW